VPGYCLINRVTAPFYLLYMKQYINIKAMEIGFSEIGEIRYFDLKKQVERGYWKFYGSIYRSGVYEMCC